MFKNYLILFAAIALLGNCTPPSDSTEQQIDSLFVDFGPGTPGAAVGVIKNGQLIFKKGYGLANLDYDIPITSTSVFDIASVSKQFGAMSIALLVDQGKISLEDDVRKYIPELADFGSPITIDNLIHHTSGVRDWPATLSLAGWRMDDIISFDQIIRFASKQKALNFQPGSEYTYSNTGYNLLAEVVQRVTGMSFSEWTRENIFDPLEMNDTHFQDDHTAVVKNRVTGYSGSEGNYQSQPNGLTALASSSLFTTVEDLAKWVANFETGKVGSPEVLDLVHRRGILTNGDSIAYAFGQSVGEYKGVKQVQHSGSWAGFRTYLVRFPEEHLAIIVLSNLGSYNPSRVAYQVAQLYLNIEEEETEEEDPYINPVPFEANEIDPTVFDKYEGDYALQPNFILSFWREDNKFLVRATGQGEVELTANTDSTFFNTEVGAAITFHTDSTNRVNRMTLHQGSDMTARRIEPFRPAPEDLAEYAGLYYSSELKTFYELKVKENSLVAEHFRHGEIVLTPVSKNFLTGDQWFFNPIHIERSGADEVTALLIGSGRMRNVRFEKVDFEKY